VRRRQHRGTHIASSPKAVTSTGTISGSPHDGGAKRNVNLEVLLGIIRAVPAVKAALDWLDKQRKPVLRLSLHDSYQTTKPTVEVVENGDRRQVVFAMTLYNDGAKAAREWKLWLASLDQDTVVHLSRPSGDTREFREERFTGGRWQAEVLSRSASDVVASHVATSLPGRHALNFPGQPAHVYLDYRLDAAGMPTQTGRLRLDIDWATRKGHFRRDA